MKLFEKWRSTKSGQLTTVNSHSIKGTPLSAHGEDFREFMSEIDGFEPGAEAYVYAVILRQKLDETIWYYVGQTTGGLAGLKSRLKKHVRGEMTKTVHRGGMDVLDSPLSEDTSDAYVVLGLERAESISVENEALQKARVLERERRMAYEIAAEKETTRVLVGA